MAAVYPKAVSADGLRGFLDGRHGAVRDRAREVLGRPEFAPVIGLGRDEQRTLATDRLRALTRAGITTLACPPASSWPAQRLLLGCGGARVLPSHVR
jgi:hypothetical protein